MVAISLYRGNLHKLPETPRRLPPPPTPKISSKTFKLLLRRRARALSRLRVSPDPQIPSPNPNPNISNHGPDHQEKPLDDKNVGKNVDKPDSEPQLAPKVENLNEEKEREVKLVDKNGVFKGEERKEEKFVEEGDCLRELIEKSDTLVVETETKEKNVEGKEGEMCDQIEKTNREDATSEAEKMKKEVKERLEILNEKKHSLVQVLKQILNAEEQLKRQTSTQGTSGRPPLPLHVDTTTDSGSMTRVNTPRLGSDGNPCGDTDVGDADDVSNHNMHSRHLPRMSSTSPSSDSQQRKPFSIMVPHSYRTTIGVASSPSRFGPGGGQGPSPVSVSGTSYVTSSPSPAASGGTSVFRDARLPSPWN